MRLAFYRDGEEKDSLVFRKIVERMHHQNRRLRNLLVILNRDSRTDVVTLLLRSSMIYALSIFLSS